MTSTRFSPASPDRRARFRPIAVACLVAAIAVALPVSLARAADGAAKATPAFRAAMKRFLVAQNIPAQMGEQVALSAAEQILTGLASSGVAVTEPMQNAVVDLARKQFGKRYGDVEYLTGLYSGIYSQHFSEKEISELAAFWESPVAKKLFAKTTVINERFVADMQSFMDAQMPAFQSEVEKRLRANGLLGNPAP